MTVSFLYARLIKPVFEPKPYICAVFYDHIFNELAEQFLVIVFEKIRAISKQLDDIPCLRQWIVCF